PMVMGGIGGIGGNLGGFQGFQGFNSQLYLGLCEVATGKLRWQAANARAALSSVAFSPDGNALAGTMANTIPLCAAASGQRVAQLAGHHGAVNAVVFTPNGKLLVSASADGTIRLWNVAALDAVARRCTSGLTSRPVEDLWIDLRAPDPVRAGQ